MFLRMPQGIGGIGSQPKSSYPTAFPPSSQGCAGGRVKMAEFPALPLFTDAFIGDTTHLTAAQTGGYLMLLIIAWRLPSCSLPDDDQKLARWARMDLRSWKVNKSTIMDFWTLGADGQWRQGRLTDERNYADHKSKESRHAAKARWLKNIDTGNADAMRTDMRIACPLPTPTVEVEKDDDCAPEKPPVDNFETVYDFGCNLYPNLASQNTSAITMWLDAGMNVQKDILPEIKRIHAKGVKVRGWGLFTQDIADANAKRLKPMPKGNSHEAIKPDFTGSSKPNKTQRAYDAARRAAEAGGYGFASRSGGETEAGDDTCPVILDA